MTYVEGNVGGRNGAVTSRPGTDWQNSSMVRAGLIPLAVLALVGACGTSAVTALPFVEPDAAMDRTIAAGTTVLASPVDSYGGHRGDIVVLRGIPGWDVPEGQPVILRVVAIGDDEVECCDASGRVLVNGQAIREGYLYFAPGRGSTQPPFAPVRVPPGHLWLLGDNRNVALDSRAAGRGPVDERSVIAVVTGGVADCSPGAVSCPSAENLPPYVAPHQH